MSNQHARTRPIRRDQRGACPPQVPTATPSVMTKPSQDQMIRNTARSDGISDLVCLPFCPVASSSIFRWPVDHPRLRSRLFVTAYPITLPVHVRSSRPDSFADVSFAQAGAAFPECRPKSKTTVDCFPTIQRLPQKQIRPTSACGIPKETT